LAIVAGAYLAVLAETGNLHDLRQDVASPRLAVGGTKEQLRRTPQLPVPRGAGRSSGWQNKPEPARPPAAVGAEWCQEEQLLAGATF